MMGMFGIKPAVLVRDGQEVGKCTCSACLQLRQVSIGARIGQGAAVALVAVLGLGGAGLVLALIAWGIVVVVRQL